MRNTPGKNTDLRRWTLTTLLLTSLLAEPQGWAAEGKTADAKKAPETSYRIKVEVREVKNRRVEGTVRDHKLYVDQPTEFGADDSAPTPPETLAFALGACLVSTGRLVAMQRNLPVRSIQAQVDGELDFARALGMKSKKRVGFSGLKLQVTIEGSLSVEDKRKLVHEIAARCPMCDNLAIPTPITYELKE
jgi:putative redox protein